MISWFQAFVFSHATCTAYAEDDGASYFTITDINVSTTVTFYGRTFFVVSCDPFTRKFLGSSGFDVPEDTGFPDEPIDAYREGLKRGLNPFPPLPREVGRRTLTPPDPQLKGAWSSKGFNPCTYQVKNRLQTVPH